MEVTVIGVLVLANRGSWGERGRYNTSADLEAALATNQIYKGEKQNLLTSLLIFYWNKESLQCVSESIQ